MDSTAHRLTVEETAMYSFVQKLHGWLVKRPDDENDIFFPYGKEKERDEYIAVKNAELKDAQ